MALAPLDQKLGWSLGMNQSLFENAKKILRTSYNFNDVKQICRFLLDPQTAAVVLQERPDHWLDAHLNDLCQCKGIANPHCDSRASKAKAIVNIVRDSAPCGDRLDGYWICEALASPDITSNAARFDTEVHSKFSKIPFSHLVSSANGFRNSFILEFLDAMFNLSNTLAQHVRGDGRLRHALVLLLQALKHPLSRWIVATALSFDASSPPNPLNALRFLFHPIRQQLQTQSSSVLPIIEKLLILEARFKWRMKNTDGCSLDDKPLSTDFTLLESVQKWSPEDLAISITKSVTELFNLLSPKDVLQDGPHMQNIREDRSNLSDDVWACLASNGNYGYFLNLAERLFTLNNVHSARAVGVGLHRSGFQCSGQWFETWSRVWDLANPNESIDCMKFMDQYPCMPCFLLYDEDLQKNIPKIFRFSRHFGREREVEQDTGRSEKAVGEGFEQNIGRSEKAVEVGVEQNIGRGGQAVGEGFEQNIGRSEKAVEQNIGRGGQAVLVNRNSLSHTKHALGGSDDRNYLNQQTSQAPPTIRQCFALTNKQCRRIQELIDPYHKGLQRDWELNYQPELIRLYMTTMSFYQIESRMTPRLTWSSKSCSNRFRDWLFPVNPIQRANKVIELYALVSGPATSPPVAVPRTPPRQDSVTSHGSLNSEIYPQSFRNAVGDGHYPSHSEQDTPLDQDLHSDMEWEHLSPTKDQCLALTDDQCRRIQNVLDPDHKRLQQQWELKYQPELIRLYMAKMSFLEIESAMAPRLTWSYKTYYNRFRDWYFPIDPTERANKIIQLYALVSRPTPANPTTAAPQGNYEFVSVVPTTDGRVKPNGQVVRMNAAKYQWRMTSLKPEQNAVNLSTIGPLSEASSQSLLDVAADLSIPSQSDLPRMTRDGQPPKPEIHTTRTQCNNTSQSFGLSPVGPDRGSHKRNRTVSKIDYPQSYQEKQAVHSSKIQGDSNRPEYPPLSYRDMILQRSANKDILRTLVNKENLPPSERAPSGIDTNPQHGNHEFFSTVLTTDGRAKPNEVIVSKDAAKYQWWKNESAKTPVRKPIVASTSRKDAIDSSSLGPLPEVPSQPAPSPLTGADPSISFLREINQERSQHWKPDERVATTHDGHPPRPEIHWQRGSTMRTDRNHLPAFGLAMNPIKVAGANAREAPPRGSRRPKRKREVSKPDSEQNSGEANNWSSKSDNIEVQVNDCATKEAAQKRARSAPRSPPPVRDKGVQLVAHEHCPVMKGGSIAPTDRNGSMPGWEFGAESSSSSSLPLAKLALDMMRDCNRKSREGNSIIGLECATASERAESWPTETLGSEESPVNEEKCTKIDIASLLSRDLQALGEGMGG